MKLTINISISEKCGMEPDISFNSSTGCVLVEIPRCHLCDYVDQSLSIPDYDIYTEKITKKS